MLGDLTQSLFSLFDEADGLLGSPGYKGQGRLPCPSVCATPNAPNHHRPTCAHALFQPGCLGLYSTVVNTKPCPLDYTAPRGRLLMPTTFVVVEVDMLGWLTRASTGFR